MRIGFVALYSILVGLVVSCGGVQTVGSPDGLTDTDTVGIGRVEPEARSTFLPAEQAFHSKNFDEALRAYRNVKAKFSHKTTAHRLATYRLGTLHYYRGDYAEAAREFEYYLGRYPQTDLRFDVQYNLAASLYQLGNYERAASLLEGLTPTEIHAQGTKRAEVIYQLWALNANALGNDASALYALANLNRLPVDEGTHRQTEEKIDYHLQRIKEPRELETLLTELKESYFQTRGTARLAALKNPQLQASPVSAESSARTELASVGAGQLGGRPLGSNSRAEKTHIGVLLPLSGKWAAYGRQALDGIVLASKVLNANRPVPYRLFIEDSASSPLTAEDAVERLVEKHQVAAVLGPLNWKESLATAERAQALGVLNLTLSSREGISGQGAYLFQNALTPRTQMENLAQYAVSQKGWKRFAMLYAQNPYGRDMANEFWSAIEKLGGIVVASIAYDPAGNDFQATARELVGADAAKHRRLEASRLAEFIKEQKTKTGREPKTQLPSILDFDAIFIPDSPKTVSQIAASLAYYDVKGIPLLGTSEWNSGELVKRGGKLVEGAVFPGGLALNAKSETQREFLRQYTEAYGTAPDLLAAQGSEAMLLVAGAIQAAGSSGRNEIAEQLAQLRDFTTPLGTLSFDAQRVARRKLPILAVEGAQIVERE